jgi:hypothetical protein
MMNGDQGLPVVQGYKAAPFYMGKHSRFGDRICQFSRRILAPDQH